MLCLIDADIILMRAAFAAERRIKKEVNGETIYTREVTSPQDAIDNVDSILANINRKYPDSTFCLLLSGDDNFRRRVAPDYKGNRKEEDKPLLMDNVKDYIKSFGASSVDHLEADDLMSLMQWADLNKREDYMDSETVICTTDKDLNSVPGGHYNFVEDMEYWITPEEAVYSWCYQMLVGDSTDNIKGVKGIGAKKAAGLLDPLFPDVEAMHLEVMKAYDTKYGVEGMDLFKQTSCLITMLTVTGEVPGLTEQENNYVEEQVQELNEYYTSQQETEGT